MTSVNAAIDMLLGEASYLGIGHHWSPNVYLWVFDGTNLHTVVSSEEDVPDHNVSFPGIFYQVWGRVDDKGKLGSITFGTGFDERNREVVIAAINAVVAKFPGVRFTVFTDDGQMSLQDYYQTIGA